MDEMLPLQFEYLPAAEPLRRAGARRPPRELPQWNAGECA